MTESAAPTRREIQRAETDKRIHDAALRVLAASGTDGLSLPAIAQASGFSTGPIYARFGGADDVIVVLWDLFLRDELVRVITLQLSWVNGNGPITDDLRELYEAPGDVVNALIEVMATLRRYSFAREVVQPQIQEILDDAAMRYPEMPDSIFKMQIGFLLGSIVARPIFAPVLLDHLFEGLEIIRRLADSRHGWDARTKSKASVPVTIPEIDGESTVRRAFIGGALETIAVTGVEGASAQRIARAAGYGFSTAYSYFKSKHELAEEALKTVIGQVFSLNIQSYVIVDHQAFVRRVVAVQRGALSEQGRLLRQLRVESVVAARRSTVLSRHAQVAFAGVIENATRLGDVRSDGEFSRLATWCIIATHAFAVPLLSGCSHYSKDIDWTPVAEQLFFVRNNFKV